MENKRRKARLACHEPCHLNWHGSTYPGTVTNVSVGDMCGHFGVHFDGPLPDVTIGDECVVSLYDDQNPLDSEFNCRVLRINTSDIALEIIEMSEHDI